MEENIYYVYAHYRIGDDVPFYVGMGHGQRAYCKHNRNPHWNNVVNKSGIEVRFLLNNLLKFDALCMEAMYINAYGRANQGKGPLVNMTDGGDSPPSRKGAKISPEHIQIIKDTHTGKVVRAETRELIRLGNTGKQRTKETIQKVREKLTGRKLPPRRDDWCTNLSNALMGHRGWSKGKKMPNRTDDWKEQHRKDMTGRKWCNNGVQEKLCAPSAIPKNWILGRLARILPSSLSVDLNHASRNNS